MRVVGIELKESLRKLVMKISGEGIELKKVPDDPAIRTECGETICSVTPRPEKGDVRFISNDKLVQKSRMFNPEETEHFGTSCDGFERKRSPRENLLEACANTSNKQIDKLAEFLLEEFPHEAGKEGNEPAVECAIRLLKKIRKRRCCHK